tara:strand:+ start:243 stop:572 length:330 start_codon:yes stop_codon:yes gene_type:complete
MKELNKYTEEDLDILHFIHNNPKLSQRAISNKLGISLGKVNYCIKALIEIGFIKIENFTNAENKLKYIYILTPKGVSAKVQIALNFLERKQEEYEKLYNYVYESDESKK